ncbi:Putative N-acetyl-glucosaminidase [gamma proteobacterium HdN1]|nr:Putative N-acetyl-glucosaminidase [gamma proteobacterium HdN1]
MSGPLMLDLPGLDLTAADADLLCAPEIGGVILFARNYEDPHQLAELVARVRAVRGDVLLAVDQEGGRVQRFKKGFTRLPAVRVLGDLYDQNPENALYLAREWGWLMAAELRAFDIDLSFAPVLDLDYSRSQVIGNRAFHSKPSAVLALAEAWIAGMAEAGMAATGKHFPGHGWVTADSHTDIPVDERTEAELQNADLQPFVRLAEQLGGMMPAHVIYSAVDAKPAGFSRYWLQTVLRERLRFQGAIFSDDLAMEGAAVAGSFSERAQQALDAGCDMVLVCNQRSAALEVLESLQRQPRPANARIQALRGQKAPTLAELKNSDRWQEARASMAPFSP